MCVSAAFLCFIIGNWNHVDQISSRDAAVGPSARLCGHARAPRVDHRSAALRPDFELEALCKLNRLRMDNNSRCLPHSKELWHLPFNLTITHSHTYTDTLSLVLVVMIKSKDLKTKISHAHSLILSPSVSLMKSKEFKTKISHADSLIRTHWLG